MNLKLNTTWNAPFLAVCLFLLNTSTAQAMGWNPTAEELFQCGTGIKGPEFSQESTSYIEWKTATSKAPAIGLTLFADDLIDHPVALTLTPHKILATQLRIEGIKKPDTVLLAKSRSDQHIFGAVQVHFLSFQPLSYGLRPINPHQNFPANKLSEIHIEPQNFRDIARTSFSTQKQSEWPNATQKQLNRLATELIKKRIQSAHFGLQRLHQSRQSLRLRNSDLLSGPQIRSSRPESYYMTQKDISLLQQNLCRCASSKALRSTTQKAIAQILEDENLKTFYDTHSKDFKTLEASHFQCG